MLAGVFDKSANGAAGPVLQEIVPHQWGSVIVAGKGIAMATGTSDLARWLKKMESRVDAESGTEVEPDETGKYPKGSIPYPTFALRYPEVKANYDRLGPLDPRLKLL